MKNELIIKNPNLPLKAYPKKDLENEFDKFMMWITNLLGLRGEESAKRLVVAIPVIEKKFWSLGFNEIKKAFEMYALGELDIKPIPNYFDVILVGQVFNAYKKENIKKPKPFNEDEYKAEQDYIHVVTTFDHFISTEKLTIESVWIYDYLTCFKNIVEFDKEVKAELFNKFYEKLPKQEAINNAKLELLKEYFSTLNAKGLHIKNLIQ